MSWKEPKTWVDQETPTATDFNTEIRDNLNALSTHSHTGAAGDGSSTLDSLDHMDLDEGGALSEPASGHTRFAANNDGTLRYFAEGDSEKTVSDTTHTHTQAEGSISTDDNPAVSGNVSSSYIGHSGGNSVTKTPSDSTGSSQYGMAISAVYKAQNYNGVASTAYINIEIDSSQVAEASESMPAPVSSELVVQVAHFEIAGANSSTVYESDFKKSGSGGINAIQYSSMTVMEVQCL